MLSVILTLPTVLALPTVLRLLTAPTLFRRWLDGHQRPTSATACGRLQASQDVESHNFVSSCPLGVWYLYFPPSRFFEALLSFISCSGFLSLRIAITDFKIVRRDHSLVSSFKHVHLS